MEDSTPYRFHQDQSLHSTTRIHSEKSGSHRREDETGMFRPSKILWNRDNR